MVWTFDLAAIDLSPKWTQEIYNGAAVFQKSVSLDFFLNPSHYQ